MQGPHDANVDFAPALERVPCHESRPVWLGRLRWVTVPWKRNVKEQFSTCGVPTAEMPLWGRRICGAEEYVCTNKRPHSFSRPRNWRSGDEKTAVICAKTRRFDSSLAARLVHRLGGRGRRLGGRGRRTTRQTARCLVVNRVLFKDRFRETVLLR